MKLNPKTPIEKLGYTEKDTLHYDLMKLRRACINLYDYINDWLIKIIKK